jgi:hypothetical protein
MMPVGDLVDDAVNEIKRRAKQNKKSKILNEAKG